MTRLEPAVVVTPDEFAAAVQGAVGDQGRLAGLVGTARPGGAHLVRALVAVAGRLDVVEAAIPPGTVEYPSLSPIFPAASWYEREIHDLFGLEAAGGRNLEPLVLAPGTDGSRPRRHGDATTGAAGPAAGIPDHKARMRGEGVFTISYGPVRSGVFESVEYLVETFGEDIANLGIRVHHKHRVLDRRFDALSIDDAALLAERVEGTCSIAHALAFCQAIESASGSAPPRAADLARLVHAEIERVANHLDSVVRHTEGAGQAVAYARMSRHKERLMRLRSRLCGHRFGRGVVVPGGVSGPFGCPIDEVRSFLDGLAADLHSDLDALMATPSFLDRLRGTGVLDISVAASHGALGPVGRGSGLGEDVRASRPYGAYPSFGFVPAIVPDQGDALARQLVRLEEIRESFRLIRQALDELDAPGPKRWRSAVDPDDGLVTGSTEAPQGELIYLVEIEGGRIVQAKPRCASFHNLPLFAKAFGGDILTDFVFIEASFGLSIAGVAG